MAHLRPHSTVPHQLLLRAGAAFVVGMACIVLAVVYWWPAPNSSEVVGVMPNTTLEMFDGGKYPVGNEQARYTVYVVWASWCVVCDSTLLAAATLAQENTEVAVVAVNRDGRRAEALAYLASKGVSGITLTADSDDALYAQLGGHAMPEVLIVKKGGSIVRHEHGPLSLDEMRKSVAGD
jgi:thiol-disulfide isomerase/thioredoxin